MDSESQDRLHNADAGEMLLTEFMEPLGLDARTLAECLGVPADRIEAAIAGEQPIDADLDLRLGRYFGMSKGFFLRLQISYELLEANGQ